MRTFESQTGQQQVKSYNSSIVFESANPNDNFDWHLRHGLQKSAGEEARQTQTKEAAGKES